MSSTPRPPRLTTACLVLGLASLVLCITSFTTLTSLTSIDMRENVSEALSSEPLDATGLSVQTALEWMRWGLTVAIILAACAVIFAIYTWRGDRASRIIITVWAGIAMLFFLPNGLWGTVAAALCVYCAVNLWTADTRQWFATVNAQSEDDPHRTGTRNADPDTPSPQATSVTPRAHDDANPETQVAAPPQLGSVGSDGRHPQSVIAAAAVTLAASIPVLIVCGINALYALLARDSYTELLHDSAFLNDTLDQLDMSADSFVTVAAAFCTVASIASVIAIIAAVALFARQRWGLWTLRSVSVVTIVIGVFAFPVGLIWAAAAVAVLVLLSRPAASTWLSS